MLAPELESELRRGAAVLGCPLSDSQTRVLLDYLALLLKWNKVYNLTAIREPRQMLYQHLLDSLALVEPLRRHLNDTPARLLDVGSGAGLPGLVIAAMLPAVQVVCVDAVAKKTTFIRQAAGELGLKNLLAQHARVETLNLPPFHVITSRAFSALADLIALTRPLMGKDSVWIAMKGKRPDGEIAALPADISMFHVEPLSVPAEIGERCLIWMRPQPALLR